MRNGLLLGMLAVFSCQASVIVSENFNGVTPGTYSSGAIGQFNVTAGSVDVVGDAFFGNLCVGSETVNCVDLSGNSAGTIATALLTLPAGAYTLMFDLNGSQRDVTTSATVTLDAFYTETFTLASADLNSFTRTFTIASPATATLQFQSNTAGVIGALLDNVTLSNNINAVPEPSSFLLFTAGAAGLALLTRRARNKQTS
jgi:PEP-CTERM motif-containing protein